MRDAIATEVEIEVEDDLVSENDTLPELLNDVVGSEVRLWDSESVTDCCGETDFVTVVV